MFAGVAVVFSDQMADRGDAAADPDAPGRQPGALIGTPVGGEGMLLTIDIDSTDPNTIVQSSPSGIDCGVVPSVGDWNHTRCAARFAPGSEVRLSAQVPPVQLELLGQAGWANCEALDMVSGFAQPTPCTVLMDVDRTVCLFTGQNDCPPPAS